MNNERKILRLKKQLEAANNLNKELRYRNTALAVENNALKNTIREMQSSLEALNEEILRNRAEHIKRISEFDEAKKRYCEATKKVRLLEKEYKKKIDSLINRIIKRT